MSEPSAGASIALGKARGLAARYDLPLLLILLLLTGLLRMWQIRHTEVTATDGIAFIEYAWKLQHQPWGQVIREAPQHPGYPLAVWAVSIPVRHWLSGDLCDVMVLSAQLVSALASCLLVLPMFYLGRELFNRRVGFWGAALFQCLPVAARVMSDALSEATFLLVSTVTLLLAVRALRSHSVLRFALCGVCGGLAYLVRPEGALSVAATGLVLLGAQGVPRWRQSWRRALTCVAALSVSAGVVASPYIALTGRITEKPTGKKILEMAQMEESPTPGTGQRPSAVGGPLLGMLAVWYAPEKGQVHGGSIGWSLWALGTELTKGFHYVLWLPALLGLYWNRRAFWEVPGVWVLVLLSLLQILVVLRVARVMGYLSERHVLILVLCGFYASMAAVQELPGRLLALVQTLRGRTSTAAGGSAWWWGPQGVFSVLMLVGLAAFALPKTLQPLHAIHVGHRAAGKWLAEHTQPSDVVVDPFMWAGYYAGRVFQEGWMGSGPMVSSARYVVLERPWKEIPSMPTLPQAERLAALGRVVYDWHPPTAKFAEVQIYLVPAEKK